MSDRRIYTFDAGPQADERMARALAEDPSLAECLEQRTLDGIVSCYGESGADPHFTEGDTPMCSDCAIERALEEGRISAAAELLAELPASRFQRYDEDDVVAAHLRIPKAELI